MLKISNAQLKDSGIYVCEINSMPRQQIARLLSVIEPQSSDTTIKSPVAFSDVNHNYTNCCILDGVPEMCHTFCHINGLISGHTPQHTVQSCLQYLPSITKCLNGGRNNMKCCTRQNIPSSCLPVCVGNFTLTTVTDHFTCMNYAAPVLACIAEGIETLPPQPEDVAIEPLSTTELKISWKKPKAAVAAKIEFYQINVTQLHTFDDLESGIKIDNLSTRDKFAAPSLYGLQLTYLINSTLNEYVVKDLKPLTMYEIRMTAGNKLGSSLATNAMRTLTLYSDSETSTSTDLTPSKELKLPNIRKCCKDGGVTLERCLDSLCDPTKADAATLSDLMICAPW